MAKDYLGLERTITINYDSDSYDESTLRKVTGKVKNYNVTKTKDANEDDLYSVVEYDASYVTEGLDEIKAELLEKFPDLEIEVFDGDMDDTFDDFTYNYSALHITI